MARLVLVGLPGVGKSTLGQALADHWSCAFVDIDSAVADDAGMPVALFIQREGETAFRELEIAALNQSLDADAVIATGAGIVTSPGAQSLLRDQTVLWLDCGNDVLVERVADGERPLLGDDHAAGVARLRIERASLYEDVATKRIDASGAVDEVLRRILTTLSEVTR